MGAGREFPVEGLDALNREALYHQPVPITASEFRPTTNDFVLLGPKRLVWGCCQETVQAVPGATR